MKIVHYLNEMRIYEVVLNDQYAKKEDGTLFYPLDSYDNEYVLISLKQGKLIYPIGYPMNFENFAIVPVNNKKPVVHSSVSPNIDKDKDFVGVFQGGYPTKRKYYLSNVKIQRLARLNNHKKIRPPVQIQQPTSPTSATSWIYYVVGVIIVVILAIVSYLRSA